MIKVVHVIAFIVLCCAASIGGYALADNWVTYVASHCKDWTCTGTYEGKDLFGNPIKQCVLSSSSVATVCIEEEDFECLQNEDPKAGTGGCFGFDHQLPGTQCIVSFWHCKDPSAPPQ